MIFAQWKTVSKIWEDFSTREWEWWGARVDWSCQRNPWEKNRGHQKGQEREASKEQECQWKFAAKNSTLSE